MSLVKRLLIPVCALALVNPGQAEEVPCQPDFEPASGGYPFTEMTEVNYALPEDVTVNRIHLTTLDVFDESNPRENNALYRLANRIHVETRDYLLRQQLLFDEGEVLEQRRLEESARLLRRQDYLYDADIRPVSLCGDELDVEVVARDTWSLTIDASFDRSGGENNLGFGIRDTNFLGHGVELSLKSKQDVERDTLEFGFKTDNLAGSRLKSRLRFADSDDGSEEYALLELPFYSLESRRAWTLSFRHGEQTDSQYFRGDDVTEVDHEFENYRVSYGFSDGLKGDRVHRWGVGYWYRRSQFSLADELPPPAIFPGDRELSLPYFEYSTIEDHYVERVNINQFERTEDLHTGDRSYVRLGYSSESLGGDIDRVVYEGAFHDTLHYSERHLLQHGFDFNGLWNVDDRETEDLVVDYWLRYIFSQTRHRSYLLNFNTTYSKNLNTHEQVVLGGDTGLRAFENRLMTGDRRVILNLERRAFTDIHLFNLIRIGWAMFVDVGRAWEPGVDSTFEDDTLANVGFGLRLASSKSDVGRFMHIDVAFPLTNRDDPDVDSSLVSVRMTNRF